VCAGIAVAATLAVNPGLLVDTVQVANDWGYAAKDYFRSDARPLWDAYRSAGRLYHLREATLYVVAVLLSPWPWLAVALSIVAVLGVAGSAERNGAAALAVASIVPVFVIALSGSGLVIVRNYLPVLPALALCVMWGLEDLLAADRARRAIALALCAAAVTLNATVLVTTAWSVRRPWDDARLARAVKAYVEARPDERFQVSRRVAELAAKAELPLLGMANVRPLGAGGEFDCMLYTPAEYGGQLPGATRLGYFRAVFGSREVDYDYYPDWIGHGLDRRVYALDASKAARKLAH
jgi:hypothetical protein